MFMLMFDLLVNHNWCSCYLWLMYFALRLTYLTHVGCWTETIGWWLLNLVICVLEKCCVVRTHSLLLYYVVYEPGIVWLCFYFWGLLKNYWYVVVCHPNGTYNHFFMLCSIWEDKTWDLFLYSILYVLVACTCDT